MEKICAAQAMEWSMELEKGLRSKKPGQPIKAVMQLGRRLQEWSTEPPITMGMSNMFDLVPGQDRLFANTILLRLADAFQGGDNLMRACILRIFLLEFKQRKRNGKQYKGILAKHRVPNYLELLRRVKMVFESGDVESRAIVLRLLGFWADFALHSMDIRYMIISSLESEQILEVKAAIFTAGCFSELSEDFASFILMKLIDISTSSLASSEVKKVALRAFAKMTSSILVANRAYKTGKKLILDSTSEEFMIELLPSLTKLASRSVSLIPEQVELLIAFFSHESASLLINKALKCLQFLSKREVSHFCLQTGSIVNLLHVLENKNFSIKLQCGVLQILCKIFSCGTLTLPNMDVAEVVKMMLIAKSCAQSLVSSMRCLAFSLLVNMTCYIKRKMGSQWLSCVEPRLDDHMPLQEKAIDFDLVVNQNDLSLIPRCVALLSMNQLIMLAGQLNEHDTSSTLIECQHLLNLCLRLVLECPILFSTVLDGFRSLTEVLVSSYGNLNVIRACSYEKVSKLVMYTSDSTGGGSIPTRLTSKDQKSTVTELVLSLCKFLGACLETLDDRGAVTSEVCQTVKTLAGIILQAGFLNWGSCSLFFLLLESSLVCHSCEYEKKRACDLDKEATELVAASHYTSWVDHEWMTLKCAKQMMSTCDFWRAYRTGIYAACQGSWFTATYIFGLLMKKANSSAYRNWLHCLTLFAGGECEILLLLFPVAGLQLMNGLRAEGNSINTCDTVAEEVERMNQNFNVLENQMKLSKAYARVCSAGEMLGGRATSDGIHYFQRWFLNLRGKFLQIMIEVVGLLNTENCNQQVRGDESWKLKALLVEQQFSDLSSQFYRLAKEFDLLATSFIDLDLKSCRSILRLALICSLIAFSVAYIPHFSESNLEYRQKKSHLNMVQDLLERLCHIDRSICVDLRKFLVPNQEKCGLLPKFGLQVPTCGYKERDILYLCRFAVNGALRTQDKAREGNKEGNLYDNFRTAINLLSTIWRRLMYIPFQMPRCFFKVRRPMGAELFMFAADAKNTMELSVLQGYHLSLNLCIQLKNKIADCPVQDYKIFCLIAAKQSDHLPAKVVEDQKQKLANSQVWSAGEMMLDLHEELLLYMSGIRAHETVGGSIAKEFVLFKPDERDQGFSTCLLDVSSFQPGSYRILWSSCCVDSSGSCWNLLPLNSELTFNVRKP